MRSRSLARVALAFAALLVALLAAELIARTLAPSSAEELLFTSPDGVPAGLYRYTPKLLQEPTPGFTGEVASLGYTVPIRINSHGLRGPEPAAGPKWVALGDSFTIAVQVAEEDTFASRVGAGLGVEMLNAGVDGYSTWQGTLRYRDIDEVLRVDGVLLTFFLGNDLRDNLLAPQMLGNPRPPGEGGHAPVRLSSDPFTRFLFRHSVLHAYARVAYKRAALTEIDSFDKRRFQDELRIFTKGGASALQELVRSSEAALMQLRDLTGSRRDRLLVAVAPPSFALEPARAAQTLTTFGLSEPDVDAPRRAVLDLLKRLNIATCDLTPALQATHDAGNAPYFRFDGHWNAAGHAVVADTVLGCLNASPPR
jgi:hypothetical protein